VYLKCEALFMNKRNLDEIPIACSLSAADLAERQHLWRELLDTSQRAREPIPGGLRLTVRPGAGAQLHALIDLERDCCPWIRFAMDGESVTMTAVGDGEEALRRMFTVI
jgi:hypothetical protein